MEPEGAKTTEKVTRMSKRRRRRRRRRNVRKVSFVPIDFDSG